MSTTMEHAMREARMSIGPRYPKTVFEVAGRAFEREQVVLEVLEAMQLDGIDEDERELYRKQALAGDFEHCIKVTSTWVTIK